MRITKIKIQNFRILQNISIDLEENLSLIVGKNNCGKTSLLLILDKFIGGGASKTNFTFDDFNIQFKEELKDRIVEGKEDTKNFPMLGINLKLFIEYNDDDNLSNIGNKVIMDLDPKNKIVVLSFEYSLADEKLKELTRDFKEFCQKRKQEKKKEKDVYFFLKEKHQKYFSLSKKSLLYDLEKQQENDSIFTDLIKEKIQLDKIISFKWISARRNVSNKDSDKTLSSQSSRMYKKLEANNSDSQVIDDFKEVLSKTDDDLDSIYQGLFKDIVEDISRLGGVKKDDSNIKIVSSLQHKQLLEENTTVTYGLGASGHSLPENHNGLGYMNLISMIFEIKILLHEFKKNKEEQPSDICLLFIEEPEAHTHPQMQSVFIKNIKTLIEGGTKKSDSDSLTLQTILTTHSSHIVSDSDFEDIKYLKKVGSLVESKNLKELEVEYGDKKDYYKFLKQYLTLNRSELFFADKAIFIEGDTERILLPAIMKKVDQDTWIDEISSKKEQSLPLLSQNISIVEVGAYSQIFEKFISFIGIKSLIITDIDSVKSIVQKNESGVELTNQDGSKKIENEAWRVNESDEVSNSSLKFFFGDKTLKEFIALDQDSRTLSKDSKNKKWEKDKNGHLLLVYQTEENGYHARSFEDAFFHINKSLISAFTFDKDEKFIGNVHFPSLTQTKMKQFVKDEIDAWSMATAVSKKPAFAMEILLNSTDESVKVNDGKENITIEKRFSNWNVPSYILEGLKWLKQD